MTIDATTKRWMRDASDEYAVANGCWFDEERGQFAVDWMEDYLYLYEGESAGEPFRCVKDWQYDATMRAFGWVVNSEEWGRKIRRFRYSSVWIPKKNKKPMALDTPLPTPNGWRTIGEIEVGDQVFDERGEPCNVVGVSPVYSTEPCYRVTFSDGDSVVVGAGHEWFVQRKTNKRKWVVCETEEMFRTQRTGGHANYSVALNGACQYPYKELPIDPYLLGAWLGDGRSSAGDIAIGADDSDGELLTRISNAGYEKGSSWQNGGGRSVCHSLPGLKTDLRSIGVLNNKHIPDEYLQASIEQRTALLNGLMDTDGCCGPKGQCILVTVKTKLKDGALELLRSLGYKPSARRYNTRCQNGYEGSAWRITFSADSSDCVFGMSRKQSGLPPKRSVTVRSKKKSIVLIEPVDTVPIRCISVDSPNHLYLAGRGMTPTHNSPTLAAWTCYLAFGDGELGQKIFPCAKDGAQVRENVMRHIHEMIRQSPMLNSECKINKSTAQVFHAATSSVIMPLSSDNAASQKAKEGLNGSPAIDEVHVVDDAFVRRISRAGISRAEPLMMEFSTVGNDTDSYGFRRYQYCEQVIRGDVKDYQTLAIIYGAPQNLTDEELDADPVKYGKLANPAWGHTIKESEFLSDYRRSKSTPRDLADFKMYRLNIWQSSATPFFDMAAWDACPRDGYIDPDRACVGALDLSSKRDFTAWVLAQRTGELVTLKCHAWLTESRAREHSNMGLPVYDWENEGWLTIIPGERIDYEIVQSRVIADCQKYKVECVGHDPWNAEETRQRLEDKGITMVEVAQNFGSLSDPTKAIEVAVLAKQLDHGGDPLLRWFAKNTVVKQDASDNIRPVKPQRSECKAIDGIVAAIMAIGQLGEETESIYKEEGAGVW